jgi:hypothetical protein
LQPESLWDIAKPTAFIDLPSHPAHHSAIP